MCLPSGDHSGPMASLSPRWVTWRVPVPSERTVNSWVCLPILTWYTSRPFRPWKVAFDGVTETAASTRDANPRVTASLRMVAPFHSARLEKDAGREAGEDQHADRSARANGRVVQVEAAGGARYRRLPGEDPRLLGEGCVAVSDQRLELGGRVPRPGERLRCGRGSSGDCRHERDRNHEENEGCLCESTVHFLLLSITN